MYLLVIVVVALILWGMIRARIAEPRPEEDSGPAEPDAVQQPRATLIVHVTGENLHNEDGTSRQGVIAQCQEGEPVLLIPDPGNPHDPHAIKVCRSNGQQIGYVARGWAKTIAEHGDSSDEFSAWIEEILDPGSERPFAAVTLRITRRS